MESEDIVPAKEGHVAAPFPKVAVFTLCDRADGKGKQLQAHFPQDLEKGLKRALVLVPYERSPAGVVREGVQYEVYFLKYISVGRTTKIILVGAMKEVGNEKGVASLLLPPVLSSPKPTRPRSRKPCWVASQLAPPMKPYRPFVVLDQAGPTKVHPKPARRAHR